MEEKLSFLKKYIHSKEKDIRIISPGQISKIDSTLIPQSWVEIFGESESEKHIEKILNIWERYSKNNLSLTIQYLRNNIQDLELLEINNHYTVLYTVKSIETKGEISYYEGGN